MARLRSAARIVLVVVLLINVGSTGVAARTQPRRIPLDTEVTRVATVHVHGQTYTVYEYDNLLPYADGIGVFAGGERVTSANTVEEVFTALARRKATTFTPANRTIERLRRVLDRSRAVQAATADAIAALNETLAYRETLKETRINGTSAWAMATRRSEALTETFDAGLTGYSEADEVRKRLMAIHGLAAELEANAKRVITLLRKRRGGQEINRSDLYRRYGALYADLGALERRLAEVERKLATIAEASRTAASRASSIPRVGSGIQRRFTSLADSLATAGRRLADAGRALGDLRAELPAAAINERYRARLMERWERRQKALIRVSATVTEGLIVLVAGAIALIETRS